MPPFASLLLLAGQRLPAASEPSERQELRLLRYVTDDTAVRYHVLLLPTVDRSCRSAYYSLLFTPQSYGL